MVSFQQVSVFVIFCNVMCITQYAWYGNIVCIVMRTVSDNTTAKQQKILYNAFKTGL